MESSVLEYALFHGLIRDHKEEDPLAISPLPTITAGQHSDDEDDLNRIFGSHAPTPVDRPHADIDALSLLYFCTESFAVDVQGHSKEYLPTLHRVRDLKLELPLLRTDHEMDMRTFETRLAPHLDEEYLLLDTVDEEAGEGLEVPQRYYNALEQLWQDIRTEKLHMTNDAFQLLSQCVGLSTDQEPPSFELKELKRGSKYKSYGEPIVPPILPMSPICSPFEPFSELERLELFPEPTSPLDEEIRKAEDIIFRRDRIDPKVHDSRISTPSLESFVNSEELGDIFSPLKQNSTPPSLPLPKHRLPYNDKVDVTLLPAESDLNPPWAEDGMFFSDALADAVADFPHAAMTPESNVTAAIDTFFDEAILPIAMEAERKIEHEQLDESEISSRVSVPVMDFSCPIAPWDISQTESQKPEPYSCIDGIAEEFEAKEPRERLWRLSGQIERELSWVAFPTSLGDITASDFLADDGSLQKYLEQPACIDTACLVWKPEGLRMLDNIDDSDEEELQPGDFRDGDDVSSLLKKRKFEMQMEMEIDDTRESAAASTNHELSNIGSLDMFMGHRMGKADYMRPAKRQDLDQKSHTSRVAKALDANVDSSRMADIEHLPAPRPLPAPKISLPVSSHQYFFSITLLSKRNLARRISRLFPTAEVIERDWSAYEPKVGNIVSDEADLIISPRTGLLITTLQMIKQRVLPGQDKRGPALPPTHLRIRAASQRYEQLFVLVSQNVQATDVHCDLTASDWAALAELIPFASAASAGTHVIYVAGGEEQLALWIVALMIHHSSSSDMPEMIAEESAEEEFLVRAGCNAFASQMILHDLQQRNEIGLGAFLRMPLKEKILRYEKLLGGRKCLTRVHEVLEASW